MAKFPLITILFAAVVALTGCNGGAARTEDSVKTGTTAADRLQEKVLTFWDNGAPKGLPEDSLEQRVADYLFLLENTVDPVATDPYKAASAREALKRMAVQVGGNEFVTETIVDYLGNPDSPMGNKSLLRLAVEELLRAGKTTPEMRARLEDLNGELAKNVYGSRIADIPLTMEDGSTTTLLKFAGAAPQTLLIIYDPDCERCKAAIDYHAEVMTGYQGAPAVLMLSTTGEHIADLPAGWKRVTTPEEELDEKFYMPALPQIFLLDPQGKILYYPWEY